MSGTTPPGEVDRLLHYMPLLVRSAVVSEWERKFCISIVARGKRGRVNPTPKQLGVMRGLVARFQDAMRDDVDLIEDGHASDE